jgi:hypothetical protein
MKSRRLLRFGVTSTVDKETRRRRVASDLAPLTSIPDKATVCAVNK